MIVPISLAFAAAIFSGAPLQASADACSVITRTALEQAFHLQFGQAQHGLDFKKDDQSLSICHYDTIKPEAGAVTSVTFEVTFPAPQTLTPEKFEEGLKVSGVPYVPILDFGVPAYWAGPQKDANRPAQLHVVEKSGQFYLGLWIEGGSDERAKLQAATALMRDALNEVRKK